jgi:hypothetical protein
MYKIGDFVKTAFCSGHIKEVIDTYIAEDKTIAGTKPTKLEVSRTKWSDRFYLALDVYRPLYAQGTTQIIKLTEVRF